MISPNLIPSDPLLHAGCNTLAATRKQPPADCIHHLFEQQVERTPNAVAVECDGRSLTYRELNAQANQLAHHLRLQGVQPEGLVGIYVERSVVMAIALLAVSKAGGVLVPIDSDLPPARVGFIVADTQMPWLLTESLLLGKLPPSSARKLCLDCELDLISQEADSALFKPEVQPSQLAYIIYTSGSTGRPKGVMITHAAYV